MVYVMGVCGSHGAGAGVLAATSDVKIWQKGDGEMKFLILGKPRAGAHPVEDRAAANKAAKAMLEKLLEDGTLDCSYQLVGGGGVAIGNADTAEDLLRVLWSYPLFSQFEWHVEPLVESVKVFELLG
jgi:hypothetical protein